MRDLRGAPNSLQSGFWLDMLHTKIALHEWTFIHYSGTSQPHSPRKKVKSCLHERTASGSAADRSNRRGCRGRRGGCRRGSGSGGGGGTGRLVAPLGPAAGLAVLPHLYRPGPKLGTVQLLDRRLGFLLFKRKNNFSS